SNSPVRRRRPGYARERADDGVSAERRRAAGAPHARFDGRQPGGGVPRHAYQPLVQRGAGGHHLAARHAPVHAAHRGQRPRGASSAAVADDLPDAGLGGRPRLMRRRRGVALIAGLWLVVAIATVALQFSLDARERRDLGLGAADRGVGRAAALGALAMIHAKLDYSLRVAPTTAA